MTHKDMVGKNISVGCYIVYAALWSRSATLKLGKVVELSSRPPGYYQTEPTLTIKVVTVDRSWNNTWESQKDGKPITLGFLDRVLIVDDVPENVKSLLERRITYGKNAE